MFDGDGDEFHPSPILLEGRYKGGVVIGLLRGFLFASKVPGEPNLYEDEDACRFVKLGLA